MNMKGYSALMQKRWDHAWIKYVESLNLPTLQWTTAMAFSTAQINSLPDSYTTLKHIPSLP